jgi:hypothetical protein
LRFALFELALVVVALVGGVLVWAINNQRRLDRRRARWLAGSDRSL